MKSSELQSEITNFGDLAFSPSVKAFQSLMGTRELNEKREGNGVELI